MIRTFALIAAALWVVGCAPTAAVPAAPGGTGPAPGTSAAKVTGSVGYLQRVALPPTAVIKVVLVDVSRADAPAIVLGEQVFAAGGRQVPFPFEIAYDPARIQANHTYAVQARIEDGGVLRFITDQRHAVITRGAPNHVELVLRPIGGAAKP